MPLVILPKIYNFTKIGDFAQLLRWSFICNCPIISSNCYATMAISYVV